MYISPPLLRRFTILRWHPIHLGRSLNGSTPVHSLRNEQLPLGHVLIWPLWVVHDARLDNNCAWEGISSTHDGGTTIATEMGRYALSRICDLGDCLWRSWTLVSSGLEEGKEGVGNTGFQFEVAVGNYDVVTVRAT